MTKINVLNLYAGIGGNRKLWPNDKIEVTAVEIKPEIAKIYQKFFPNDKVIIGDAHQYLLEHYNEFDFIWSSPPCPTHSRIRRFLAIESGQNKPLYPDMQLYQEIIFLQYHFNGKWVVENVISYYEPLIKPQEVGKHYFWSNFLITKIKMDSRHHNSKIDELQKRKGFDLSNYNNIGIEKKLLLRNCVEPELALHIFNCAFKIKQVKLSDMVIQNDKKE